jgi:hypothetical protein
MVLLMVHASVTEHIGLTATWVGAVSLHWCHGERVEYRQTCCKRGSCFKSGDDDSYSFDLQGVISIYIHV